MPVDKQIDKVASMSLNFLHHLSFSDLFSALIGPAKARYRQKADICRFDPFTLEKSDCSDFSSISYPDIDLNIKVCMINKMK